MTGDPALILSGRQLSQHAGRFGRRHLCVTALLMQVLRTIHPILTISVMQVRRLPHPIPARSAGVRPLKRKTTWLDREQRGS